MSGPHGRGARQLPHLPVTVAAVGSALVGLTLLITTAAPTSAPPHPASP
ncbi:hypothetical protein [Streptomyces mirabilis]